MGSSSLNMVLAWSTRLFSSPLYWTVVALSRVDLIGTFLYFVTLHHLMLDFLLTPSLFTTIVPITPLWLTNLFRVSSTSDAIFLKYKLFDIFSLLVSYLKNICGVGAYTNTCNSCGFEPTLIMDLKGQPATPPPVWINMCSFRFCSIEKDYPQFLHKRASFHKCIAWKWFCCTIVANI